MHEATLYCNACRSIPPTAIEARRRDAMAVNGGQEFRAAAAASAICLVVTKLAPGQSTDGAVFYPNAGKPLRGTHGFGGAARQ